MASADKRLEWLDISRGIGIIAVVFGHMAPPGGMLGGAVAAVYLFHMPLFFILSGYNMHSGDLVQYIKHRSRTLLVPYASYLLLIGLPFAIFEQNGHPFATILQFLKFLYGGKMLYGYMGVFWFVTCLYFTQIIFKLAVNAFGSSNNIYFFSFVTLSYIFAYIISWRSNFSFPLAVNVVPMALVFLWVGSMYKVHERRGIEINILTALCICAVLYLYSGTAFPTVNMKIGSYGAMFFGLITAASLSFGCITLSKWIEKVRFLSSFFSQIGKASITIMFLSQLVGISLLSIHVNAFIAMAAAVLIPFIAHQIFSKNKYTAFLLLGAVAPSPQALATRPAERSHLAG